MTDLETIINAMADYDVKLAAHLEEMMVSRDVYDVVGCIFCAGENRKVYGHDYPQLFLHEDGCPVQLARHLRIRWQRGL
jgi:hypothetical protein